MTTSRFSGGFRQMFCRFGAAQAGNTAITFALAFIPLVGLVGAAVDYSRANQLQTAMQAAADTTALMVAQGADSQSASAVQSSANNIYNSLFTNKAAANLKVAGTYARSGNSTVVVTATATYRTSFMGIVGFPSMPLAATSTATFANTRLRIALVLDNTGSMADAGKMTALQGATNSLLDQLKASAIKNGDVYVSIVPFVKDVNLGASNYNANWIDWTDWDAKNSPANHNTWNGCVTDRGTASGPSPGNYDTNVAKPTPSSTDTLFAAEQYDSCPQAVMGLSYDWTSMKSLVNNMKPAGSTNQAIGLQLGWMSLTGGGPFTVPNESAKFTYAHVIILLTDGLNTEDRWYSNASQIDARQAMTCANIKAAGITLYTIQVNTDGDPTSSLLQTCASDSGKFFLLTSANQIVSTFAQIGTNLSKLHIAK
jgi:Flp pilus assembly protein TadG